MNGEPCCSSISITSPEVCLRLIECKTGLPGAYYVVRMVGNNRSLLIDHNNNNNNDRSTTVGLNYAVFSLAMLIMDVDDACLMINSSVVASSPTPPPGSDRAIQDLTLDVKSRQESIGMV